MFKALLLLLPTVAFARLNIIIECPEPREFQFVIPSLLFYGDTETEITEKDREIWAITDGELNKKDMKCFQPTSDKEYDYQFGEVHRNLNTSQNSFTADVWFETVTLATKTFHNDKDTTVEYSVGEMKASVEESVATTWFWADDMHDTISYDLKLRGWDAPNVTFTGAWGKDVKKSKTATVVAESRDTINLQPGETVVAILIANRVYLSFQLQLDAYLSGDVSFINKRVDDGLVYLRDIRLLINNCNMPNIVSDDVLIKLVFYADGKIDTKNGTWDTHNWKPMDHHKPISEIIHFDE